MKKITLNGIEHKFSKTVGAHVKTKLSGNVCLHDIRVELLHYPKSEGMIFPDYTVTSDFNFDVLFTVARLKVLTVVEQSALSMVNNLVNELNKQLDYAKYLSYKHHSMCCELIEAELDNALARHIRQTLLDASSNAEINVDALLKEHLYDCLKKALARVSRYVLKVSQEENKKEGQNV